MTHFPSSSLDQWSSARQYQIFLLGLVVTFQGLAVSLALRCDDCVRYHVERSIAEGASARELTEAMTIALVVGGSITIPHLRRAFEAVDAFSG